ncbi:MAG: glycosyltransferase family 2 protein [Planctomycetota bacterium]|nr:MAG: glycosyltransferase family 2 protein [Planctomycetota bacterium]
MLNCTLVFIDLDGAEHDRRQQTLHLATQLAARQAIFVGPAGGGAPANSDTAHLEQVCTDRPLGGLVWNDLLERILTPTMVTIWVNTNVSISRDEIQRLVTLAGESDRSMVYSDYVEDTPAGFVEHPTIDYQIGSIRDDFDFGPITAWSMEAIRHAQARGGPLADTACAALYDLRLRVSEISRPLRIPETLYRSRRIDPRLTGARQFDYLDPQHKSAQQQMEQVATEHLRRIGAYLPPVFTPPATTDEKFPVEAGVIIPVRNREKTITDAVRSALEQKTSFDFNVIVVDNHSTDGTTKILEELSAGHRQLIHMVPAESDLQIGGCWNLAVSSPSCGRIAVQLDSDDLYAGPDTLQKIVDETNRGPYAMVVGAYRMVDFDLQEIPPGIIDHREWTRDNGRNNLLRVNGLGAPRAFNTAILRRYPMPNVSYGEDYAVGLRFSREYEIGRIYQPIYLCRRWEGNSDADLPIETLNRYHSYKDSLRTDEILDRQKLNLKGGLTDK